MYDFIALLLSLLTKNLLTAISVLVSIIALGNSIHVQRRNRKLSKQTIKLREQAIQLQNQSIEQAQKTYELSVQANQLRDQANTLTEKVNSKEHDISENLKYEVLKVISTIRALDTKAAVAETEKRETDYSKELELLTQFQTSPEYLLFLKSIKDDDDRLLMEVTIRLLTQPSMPTDRLREWTHLIINRVNGQTDLDAVIKQIANDYHNNWNQLVKELCEMKGVFTLYNERAFLIEDEFTKVFFKYLIDD